MDKTSLETSDSVGGPELKSEKGALEEFIRTFNQYESDENLFERCRDKRDFAWWDVVRYSIQFALCAEMGVFSLAKGGRQHLLARVVSLARQSTRLFREAFRIFSLRRNGIERIYVFRRRSKYMLEEIDSSGPNCLVFGETSVSYSPHAWASKQSVDFLVRIMAPFVHVPGEVLADANQLHENIRAKFNSQLDVRSMIVGKYKQYRASRLVWSAILARQQGVNYVGFIGDDTLKALVSIANAQKIKTREFQHAYMGKSHIGYSYPKLAEPVPTLPAEVMVHRDTGDIIYPSAIVKPADTGVSLDEPIPDSHRELDVLIGGSPTFADETISITGALVNKGLALAVKLHPAQTEADSGLRNHFTQKQVKIYSKEHDFCTLARKARIYIAANPTSTTVFEAVENGARFVVVDYNGVKLTELIDGIVSARASAFEDLYGVVHEQLELISAHGTVADTDENK